jgi:hypothetical protein
MPDEKFRNLLENPLGDMDVLVKSTFVRSREEMKELAKQSEKYCSVMIDILF